MMCGSTFKAWEVLYPLLQISLMFEKMRASIILPEPPVDNI